MTNKEIAKIVQNIGKLMDLHGESSFKSKSYANAYQSIRRISDSLLSLEFSELQSIRGIGKGIATDLVELREYGHINIYEELKKKTPFGIQEMLNIKGLGPKKIKTIWREMNIDSVGDLLYACEENRLVEQKGFGLKTQENIKAQIAYFMASKGKFLYPAAYKIYQELKELLEDSFPDVQFGLTGDLLQLKPTTDNIHLVLDQEIEEDLLINNFEEFQIQGDELFYAKIKLILEVADPEYFVQTIFEHSGSSEFTQNFNIGLDVVDEDEIFESNDYDIVPPELRHSSWILKKENTHILDNLIDQSNIKGIVHNHSTYSDGLNTLSEMSLAVKSKGYQYFVISDHSKSAFYAGGLSIDDIERQWNEIDRLNQELDDFHIFKSIESDILSNGDLDYEDAILDGFDLIIASVHSNLKMDREKATKRLITAIENPYTRILGHLTGRLLLSREGYPIDHKKIIDACSANNVVIELNANPYRLDIDEHWIQYAMKKEVMISINPDAHSISGIDDVQYGVNAARRGGLSKNYCLNAKDLKEFTIWVNNK